jgi:hypothetical protein
MNTTAAQLIAHLRRRLADEKPLSDASKLGLLRKIEAAMPDPLPDERIALEELRQQILDRAHAETLTLRGRGKPRAPN